MPNGFSGRAAVSYLTEVSEAHTEVINAIRQLPPGLPPGPSEISLPHTPSDATSGGFSTGRGNSSNIVMSESDCQVLVDLLSRADDKMGECLYKVAEEIDLLCQTSFILPQAVPRCLNISDNIKRSLGQFRGVTEDAVAEIRRFAREISDIG